VHYEFLVAPEPGDTNDPERNLLIGAMRAIESYENSFGWDQEPRLLLVKLIDRDGNAGAMVADVVPARIWFTNRQEPPAGLQFLSWGLPTVDREARHIAYADSPAGVAAAVFISEAWALRGDDVTAQTRARADRGERFISADPRRVECRTISAADINGNGIAMIRFRDEDKPTDMISYNRADLVQHQRRPRSHPDVPVPDRQRRPPGQVRRRLTIGWPTRRCPYANGVARLRPTAAAWHRRNHRRPDEALGGCWECQRDQAVCRTKIRFGTREEADEWVDDLNRTRRHAVVVSRYPCRWCPGWHMKTATTRQEFRRVEKARRKTLWQPA